MVSTIIKVLGTEASVTTASTVGGAKLVRVYNSNGSDALITVTDASSTVIGTVTVKDGTHEYVAKNSTDTLTASAEIGRAHV